MENYRLYKVKPGKRQQWLDWCNKLSTVHHDEAASTLVEEDLVNEMCVLFGVGDDSYLLYRHTPLAGKTKKSAVMERELNKEHFKNYFECLELVKGRVLGYDITTK